MLELLAEPARDEEAVVRAQAEALRARRGAFLAHPSPLRAKVTPVDRPSPVLGGLAVVGAVPLAVYAVGQISIHLGSGPADQHYEFGHWVVIAAVALIPGVTSSRAAGCDGGGPPEVPPPHGARKVKGRL